MKHSLASPRPASIPLAAVLLTAAACGCAAQRSNQTPQNPPANDQAVREAFDRWAAGQGGPFELLTDDAQWTIAGSSPKSQTYQSKQQFLDEVIGPFNARLSRPLVPSVRRIYADGDTVVVLFDARATARDGLPYTNTYAWFLQMRAGRIVNATAFFDTRLFDEFWTRVPPAR